MLAVDYRISIEGVGLKRIGIKLLWLAAVLGLSMPLQAARVGDLYTAELLVAEQSVRVAPELVSQALQQVLVKVSGRRDAIEQAAIQSQLVEAQRYIQQFRYQATNQPLPTEDGREVLAHRLTIDFERTLVNELLASGGLRPLGAVRPGLLVWLLEERNGHREFLGRDEDPVFTAMKQRARERGLPIFRPLMDLQDQRALPVSDAWGFFRDTIAQASSRYQSDAVLVGRLYQRGSGRWSSQWLLLKPQGAAQNFGGEGEALAQHLSMAVDQASDLLFVDFVAPVGELDPGMLLLEVEAVESVDDYFRISRYLEELPSVKSIKLQHIEQDRLKLLLEVEGAVSQLRSVIGLNGHLQSLPDFGESDSSVLYYRWQR